MPRREKIPETSAKRRDGYHHGDLKRALTEAALGLVNEKGPKGFTLREVARRAGVSAAAPYRHFADKAELLAAVATRGFIQLHDALGAVGSATDPSKRVIDMGRAYVLWAVTHPDYYQAMFGAETNKGDHPELLTAGERAFDDLLEAITRCQDAHVLPSGDPREVAGPAWSLLHGIASLTIGRDLTHVGIRDDPPALADRALSALLFATSH
ncbi:TetR/AcrR family transcriptional regulator [Mycobacterium decipiens]|uniref:TetR family transcriptional regulator n=1 Tax=Mycobacterium decipiens TaxID=1430326 RepID=A0A1X2LPB2_9MYCO|nr:TetR/AcrR family transcriptional regulator [Mycobacterium decipiens]OSC37232.1 TetR family transcriptional regulator [Mycobacterium decipiens]